MLPQQWPFFISTVAVWGHFQVNLITRPLIEQVTLDILFCMFWFMRFISYGFPLHYMRAVGTKYIKLRQAMEWFVIQHRLIDIIQCYLFQVSHSHRMWLIAVDPAWILKQYLWCWVSAHLLCPTLTIYNVFQFAFDKSNPQTEIARSCVWHKFSCFFQVI